MSVLLKPSQCCHARMITSWFRRHIASAELLAVSDSKKDTEPSINLRPIPRHNNKFAIINSKTNVDKPHLPQINPQTPLKKGGDITPAPNNKSISLQRTRRKKRWVTAEDSPADMTSPHLQYPVARNMSRKIIYHAGPTNSGKTRAALEALKKASNGIYAAPLRLLAWEVYEKLNADGTPCGLLTGQESENSHRQHLSCTVEMVDTDISYECAVLDEIQMLGDPDRGWAWTRAFLGLPAAEIHLCGDESAELLVRALAKQCGDTFEIRHYNRLLPLKMGLPLSSMKWQARPGDCFVGFGRKDLYGIRHDLESARNDLEISIVYGNLPPETRKNQALQFNAVPEDGKHKVLVASDAIGMGLNLNIGRIVFTSLEKYDGTTWRVLNRREIKQIAGRAGRYGKEHAFGEVVCMDEADSKYVAENLNSQLAPIVRAGIAPTTEQLTAFHKASEEDYYVDEDDSPTHQGFAGTIERFMRAAVVSNLYSMCKNEQILAIAVLLEKVPELSLSERHTYCQAPVATQDPVCMSQLLRLARGHAQGCVGIDYIPEVPRTLRFESDMLTLEVCHKMLDVFQWLARRFPKIYCLEETNPVVQTRQAEVCTLLEQGLRRSALSWKRRVRRY